MKTSISYLFIFGLFLRLATPALDIIHEAGHVMAFSADGIDAYISSWSSTQPAQMSRGGLLGAYYIEWALYFGLYLLLSKTKGKYFFLGIVTAILIKAPISDDFITMCYKYYGSRMVVMNLIRWILLPGGLTLALWSADKRIMRASE
jgi:hypothetical protein